MEIALTPEQEARLIQMAEFEGKTPSELVVDAVLEADLASHHWDDESIGETIRQRVAEADKGIFIEEEEMDARVQRIKRCLDPDGPFGEGCLQEIENDLKT